MPQHGSGLTQPGRCAGECSLGGLHHQGQPSHKGGQHQACGRKHQIGLQPGWQALQQPAIAPQQQQQGIAQHNGREHTSGSVTSTSSHALPAQRLRANCQPMAPPTSSCKSRLTAITCNVSPTGALVHRPLMAPTAATAIPPYKPWRCNTARAAGVATKSCNACTAVTLPRCAITPMLRAIGG